MLAYLLRRVAAMVPLLWAVATVTFLLMQAVPGGPFDRDKPLPPDRIAALEQKYHLDDGAGEQYLHFLADLVRGDFGTSFARGRPVTDIFRDGLPATLQLGLSAFALVAVLGVAMGAAAAGFRNRWPDQLLMTLASLGVALPSFVVAAALASLFAVELGWFDVLGWEFGNPRKMVLPVVALALLPTGYVARLSRAAIVEALSGEYVRTARAKGLAERQVVLRHALRNAAIPILTVLGPILAALLTGSFVIESIFAIDGVGTAFVDGVAARDYGVVMGAVLLYAFAIAVANLAVDVAYGFVDPRVAVGRG